ncbi:hypothetical protein 3 [Hubei myriapoda virus 3]|uniref:hypothetical protein 3 n=1 Tax=Hubei myriapoda virus 3 TaxID=1922932 RepID=UPI000909DB32|nr:hypothetical protein 3 [Hubei myriapoda virus 3]APG77511.1 hypothetical protein 3 [Hubei myriapoda virus 3]
MASGAIATGAAIGTGLLSQASADTTSRQNTQTSIIGGIVRDAIAAAHLARERNLNPALHYSADQYNLDHQIATHYANGIQNYGPYAYGFGRMGDINMNGRNRQDEKIDLKALSKLPVNGSDTSSWNQFKNFFNSIGGESWDSLNKEDRIAEIMKEVQKQLSMVPDLETSGPVEIGGKQIEFQPESAPTISESLPNHPEIKTTQQAPGSWHRPADPEDKAYHRVPPPGVLGLDAPPFEEKNNLPSTSKSNFLSPGNYDLSGFPSTSEFQTYPKHLQNMYLNHVKSPSVVDVSSPSHQLPVETKVFVNSKRSKQTFKKKNE